MFKQDFDRFETLAPVPFPSGAPVWSLVSIHCQRRRRVSRERVIQRPVRVRKNAVSRGNPVSEFICSLRIQARTVLS